MSRKGEIYSLYFRPKEQGVPREQKDLLSGLSLLRDTFTRFLDGTPERAGLIKTATLIHALSPHRREQQGDFLAFGSQIRRTIAQAQTLSQRTAELYTSPTLYASTRRIRSRKYKRWKAVFNHRKKSL